MWYWSVAILFWQLSIDDIVNGRYKRYGLAKTHLRHPSLPFHSLPYPTRTIRRRVRTYKRTLGHSRDNQTKRGWPYSMSMGLCPTRASRAGAPLQRNLYSNHTETIIKHVVTNLNNHKTQNRSGHLVYWSSERKTLQKQHFMISFTNSEKITTVNKIKN